MPRGELPVVEEQPQFKSGRRRTDHRWDMPARPPAARTLLGLLAAMLLLAGLVAPLAPTDAAPASSPGDIEAQFVARINALRSSRGLGTLTVHGELTAASRSWAGTMAGEGRIFHASDLSAGVSANWAKLGENVGVGGDVGGLFDAFVASPTHLDNLVDPSFTHVGVGVVFAGGRIFTTHRFMALRQAAPSPPPPPPAVAPRPPPPPPTVAPTTTTAAPTTTTTIAPTTTTTVAPTTVSPEPPGRLGPIEQIPQLLRDGDGR